MKMKCRSAGLLSSLKGSFGGDGHGVLNDTNLEIRSSGMVVQTRSFNDSNVSSPPPLSTIRIKVKFESYFHEININPQARFGELKKLLAERTGLHHNDQKLMFKKKERDSKAYLDVEGVKQGSKLVLLVDTVGREKRLLELHRTANMEKASKAVKEITVEVDNLGDQVKALESVVSGGGKVSDMEVQNLIELLMTQAVKLERIVANGDVKQERRTQERRVQMYVETIDQLKAKSEVPLPLNSVTMLRTTTANQDSKLSWEIFE